MTALVWREPARDVLIPGVAIGDLVIEELVAAGGFAALYRASRFGDGQQVAVKVLHRDLASSRRIQARFRREVETIRLLDHPRIVSILDHGWLWDGRPYLVMPWIEGRSLADEVATRGSLPWPEVADLAQQIACALEAAHARGIIHRDLKADNVLVSGRSPALDAVLVNFGLAKIVDPDAGGEVLTTATPIGSPVAMAPEQILGRAIGVWTDVYALGVVCFHMGAGRPPFVGMDAAAILDAHLHAEAPRLGELVPTPPAVEALVARCLAKDPADRPASPGRAAAALADAVRPHGKATARDQMCVAVYVLVTIDDDDDLRLDTRIEDARRALRSAGLEVTWEIGNALLAVAPAGDPRQRRRALDCARALAGPDAAIYVHAGPARVVAGRVVGGELCAIAGWTDADPRPGTFAASPSALES